jgi:hypothetical protein
MIALFSHGGKPSLVVQGRLSDARDNGNRDRQSPFPRLKVRRLDLDKHPVPRQNSYMACELRYRGRRSGGPVVLVDDAAEQLSSPDGGVEVDHRGWIVFGGALVSALVRAMLVEVMLVLA